MKRRKRAGHVYCIQCGVDGPVKVGFTTMQPELRLAELQVGNPVELRLLGVIPVDDVRAIELELHELLDQHWIRGEWFAPDEDVFAVFAEARERHRIQLRSIEKAA